MKNIQLFIRGILNILLLAIGLNFSGTLFSSCNQDSEVRTLTVRDTVVIKDTIIVIDTVTRIDSFLVEIQDSSTTFILVRHAEKESTGTDPNLSPEGQLRAIELSRILATSDLKNVYSTNFNRTLQTAQPISDSLGISPSIYDPSNLNPFINTVLADHHSEIVLVVGHSNTTPDLINKLIGENRYSIIPEDQYNDLFVVSVLDKGRSQVIHLKYGN